MESFRRFTNRADTRDRFAKAVIRFIAVTAAMFVSTLSASACSLDERIVFISCRTVETVELVALDQNQLVPESSDSQLTITGTYSSGDRFGIEGLAIVDGTVVSSRFQGWDGLFVITPDGKGSIHNVERVRLGKPQFNLRNPDERAAFLSYARENDLSVIQSHLLVSDGNVDVSDRPGQPRFRRRILFQTNAGDFGLFDSGESLTLFQAAVILHDDFDADMAFNLDMGAYDYCMRGTQSCGWLGRQDTGILTNVLIFTY